MTATNIFYNFVGFRYSPPPPPTGYSLASTNIFISFQESDEVSTYVATSDEVSTYIATSLAITVYKRAPCEDHFTFNHGCLATNQKDVNAIICVITIFPRG